MKNLTRGAIVLLLLGSNAAGADQKYPAADFQPEVVYQDNDYIAKNSPSTTTTKSPASSKASTGNEVDSKYPAANFQPEVLYHDPNYKPSESLKAKASGPSSATATKNINTSVPENVTVKAATEEKSSFSNYMIGLVILALAGFFLFKKRTTTTSVQKKATASTSDKKSYALNTGVAKYLNKVSGTGVSRYLEKQVKSASAATGVAKYLAKQATSPKSTVAKSATGVEKYMRDRG